MIRIILVSFFICIFNIGFACECEEHALEEDNSVIAEAKEVLASAKIIYTEKQIEAAIAKMAGKITQELKDKNPIVITVLVGGMIPSAEIIKHLDFPLQLDYLHATRYEKGMLGKDIHWVSEPSLSLNGRTVLIIDDIIDKGVTMTDVVEYCKEQGASEVYTAALVNKNVERAKGAIKDVNFVAIDVENKYIFGYGMDYKDGYLRNLKDIYVVADKHDNPYKEEE